MTIRLYCIDCNSTANLTDWRCTQCGGVLEIDGIPHFDADKINTNDWSLWRYSAMLPVEKRFTLGAGMTPLVDVRRGETKFKAKLDFLNPTGSYKDRGTATMLNHLLAQGVTDVVEDSSGNAGSSVAAYAAAAGLKARIYVPAAAPDGKKRQIKMSAEIVEVGGTRQDVTDACIKEVEEGRAVYATHAWNPFFIAGQMTAAWEIWEQMGRAIPDAVVCPVGQGLYLLGYARGFAALKDAGLIQRVPRIYGVQAAACDPVVRGWEAGADEPPTVEQGQTVADGIVIRAPVRGREVLKAIRDSEGSALRVAEAKILPARDGLAKRGLFVEPTSATTFAALPQVIEHIGSRDATIVLALTGHGLKAAV